MASTGGRAPPGQNTPMPCAGSHLLGVTRGFRAPSPSCARVRRSSGQVVVPDRFRNVSPVQPIFDAIEPMAAHCEVCSFPCSSTIRTARSRTSGENRLEVFFVMAPPSQAVEPPTNPGRFSPADQHRSALLASIRRASLFRSTSDGRGLACKSAILASRTALPCNLVTLG